MEHGALRFSLPDVRRELKASKITRIKRNERERKKASARAKDRGCGVKDEKKSEHREKVWREVLCASL